MSHNASASNKAKPSSGSESMSSSLLDGVKAQDAAAWRRMVDLYGPLVYWWCRKSGLQPEDAADVVQEVFMAVGTHVAQFRRKRPKDSFRGWLATITRNKIRDYFRRLAYRPQAKGGDVLRWLLEIPEPQEPHSAENHPDPAECLLPDYALEPVRLEFEDRTWQAFWRVAVEGQFPANVASDLGVSVHSVYKAKSRVLHRLRREFGDLLD